MKSRIIASLDVLDRQNLLNIASSINDLVFSFKINWPTILSCGKNIVGELSKIGNVILDLKIADIPNTNRMIIEQFKDYDPFGYISHVFPGRDSLMEVVKSADGKKVFAVCAMSNDGAKAFMNRFYKTLIETARDVGVYGIVAPGNDYQLLKEIEAIKGNMKIISPGIGAQGGNQNEAIKNGADYIIVGRTIYQSENPRKTVEDIIKTIEE